MQPRSPLPAQAIALCLHALPASAPRRGVESGLLELGRHRRCDVIALWRCLDDDMKPDPRVRSLDFNGPVIAVVARNEGLRAAA